MRYSVIFVAFVWCAALVGGEPFVWKLLPYRDHVAVEVTVAPDHYFYDNTLSITVTGADGKTLLPAQKAAATLFKDEFSGDTAIYPAGVHGLSLGTEVTAAANRPELLQPEVTNWLEMVIRWLKTI